MAFLSIFDVIGPNMIGPSSSHTAGACNITNTAVKLFGKEVVKVEFTLYGSFAKTYRGHGTDRALLGGILGFNSDDDRIRDAYALADSKNIIYSFEESSVEPEHPNMVDVIMNSSDNDKMIVRGISVGGGKSKIVAINDTTVEFYGEYPTLVIDHMDKRGVLSSIFNTLSEFNINIAFMKVFRDVRGENASAILECDDVMPTEIVDILSNLQNIKKVTLLQL